MSRPSPLSKLTSEMSLLCESRLWTHLLLRRSQMRTLWSSPAVARYVPLGWKSTLITCFPCPVIGMMDLPLRRSQTRTTPPRSDVATKEPSGCTAAEYVGREWPSWSRSSELVAMSHRRQLMSCDVVIRCSPIGWKTTLFTRSSWPSSTLMGWLSVRHQRFTRPSAQAEAMRTFLPSNGGTPLQPGCHAMLLQRSSCPRIVSVGSHEGTFQSLMKPDHEDVPKSCPSGENLPFVSGRSSPTCETSATMDFCRKPQNLSTRSSCSSGSSSARWRRSLMSRWLALGIDHSAIFTRASRSSSRPSV
mmetsp:Transcript_55031/g.144724  ORF Transcript_55031/g.144724 Transcript_55031/m.144724 type:complete len:303 (-) Transcript_55031:437-1345(-)